MTDGIQFELRSEVGTDLVDPLESYFYECADCPWGMVQREPTDPYQVFGFFASAALARAAYRELRGVFPLLPDEFSLREIRDSEWQNAYKAFVRPWSDRRLHWIPLWEREAVEVPDGAVAVYLDAGMAFGTGSHETTRLCARRLLDDCEAHAETLANRRVVDAGCGSGVLALSAAALGYRDIAAFDFDPDAIAVCKDNAASNPTLTGVRYAVADLETGLGDSCADLLLANIQTSVLIPHSDPLVRAVAPGGTLALSGILTHELDGVRAHYQRRFEALRPECRVTVDTRNDGEWSDLVFELAV